MRLPFCIFKVQGDGSERKLSTPQEHGKTVAEVLYPESSRKISQLALASPFRKTYFEVIRVILILATKLRRPVLYTDSMTPNSLSLLTKPSGHLVYPHTDDAHLAEAVGLFTSAGLRRGEAVILITTAAHCEPIRERLEREGFNLKELEMTGLLVCEDAEKLLSTFVFDGIVDELRFKARLGRMIEKAKTADGKRRAVRIFGEMVDLLWKSNARTTERLEELWNEVIDAHSVPLLCAYSLAGTKPGAFPQALVAFHSHAVA